jgi:hypothetical protein
VKGVCVFCGFEGKLTAEHVLPKWLLDIGLDLEPMAHDAGALNRIGRAMGVSLPFTRTVKDVCAACNGGWMSDLENGVKDVLRPLIRGESSTIPIAAHGVIAAWIQKTALVGMRVTAKIERNELQVPVDEYRLLFERRQSRMPLPNSQFWFGRYDGRARVGSIWTTPMIVAIDGLPQPQEPQAYLMTIVVGRLLLQGLRFTTPGMDMEVRPGEFMRAIWPAATDVAWTADRGIDDESFVRVVTKGRHLRTTLARVRLEDWKPATELPRSRAVGSMVELPTACGRHVVYYPGELVRRAMQGDFYWFVRSCECSISYLYRTEADGTHCFNDGSAEDMASAYESLAGGQVALHDENDAFVCKQAVAQDSDRK